MKTWVLISRVPELEQIQHRRLTCLPPSCAALLHLWSCHSHMCSERALILPVSDIQQVWKRQNAVPLGIYILAEANRHYPFFFSISHNPLDCSKYRERKNERRERDGEWHSQEAALGWWESLTRKVTVRQRLKEEWSKGAMSLSGGRIFQAESEWDTGAPNGGHTWLVWARAGRPLWLEWMRKERSRRWGRWETGTPKEGLGALVKSLAFTLRETANHQRAVNKAGRWYLRQRCHTGRRRSERGSKWDQGGGHGGQAVQMMAVSPGHGVPKWNTPFLLASMC